MPSAGTRNYHLDGTTAGHAIKIKPDQSNWATHHPADDPLKAATNKIDAHIAAAMGDEEPVSD